MQVGILVLTGMLGCETHPPDPTVSEAAAHLNETSPSSPESAQPEEGDDEASKIARWGARVTKNREEATKAWEKMYEEQRNKNEWSEAHRGKLWAYDVKEVEILPEYQSFIKDRSPYFERIVDRRRMTADGMAGIVEWDQADYTRVMVGASWSKQSTLMENRRNQESSWVYEAILRAIAHTNRVAGATSYDDAAIKRIVTLKVGQPVVAIMLSAKRSGLLQPMAAVIGYGLMRRGYGDLGSDGNIGGFEPAREKEYLPVGPPLASQPTEQPTVSHYVDASGEPLDADSDSVGEFKLLPIHLVVVMHQAKVHCFFVSLANAELPVDVKYVQIQDTELEHALPETEDNTASNGGSKDLVPVEILGVVRIYNPPSLPQ